LPDAHTATPAGQLLLFLAHFNSIEHPRCPKASIVSFKRMSYSLRDEEYLRLKIFTCMLDSI
jgi:hypothetical protein